MPARSLSGALLCAAALAASGCGGGGNSTDKGPPAPTPAANPQDFPAVNGRTLEELFAGMPQGPTLAAAVSQLAVGQNRFGFGLFDSGRKQITGADVAIYTATPDLANVRGPFPARSESLAVKAPFLSRTSAQDPDAAKSVYVARVPFSGRGQQVVIALARLDGRLIASTATKVDVGGRGGPPEVGQPMPRIHTPTLGEVGGDASKIDTRVPPDTMHDVDLATVLGKRPAVLVVATPALCESRVCGPVVDEAEELKARYGEQAAFVHLEVYNNNTISDGYRPQFRALHLPSEPWVFVIDRRGRVAARFEGPVSVYEIEQAVKKVV
jgi:hypothetical protein